MSIVLEHKTRKKSKYFKTPTIGGRAAGAPLPLLEGHTVRYDKLVQIKTACKVSPTDGQRKESVLLHKKRNSTPCNN